MIRLYLFSFILLEKGRWKGLFDFVKVLDLVMLVCLKVLILSRFLINYVLDMINFFDVF